MSLADLRGQQGKDDVSIDECQAIRHLSSMGWSTGELKMTLGRGDTLIQKHRSGECSHPDVAPPGISEEPEQEPIPPEVLQAARCSIGLNQSDVAEELGVARSTVSGWERGRSKPRRERLTEIRELLPVEETQRE